MNALDSPLEALAFSYLSYGILTVVNSIWPLVAVLTAALSFWKIRALSSSKLVRRGKSPDGASTSLSPVDDVVESAAAEPPSIATRFNTEHLSGSNTRSRCPFLERQGSTKVKFTLYYDKDEIRTGNGGDNGGRNCGESTGNEELGRCCDDWERMMVMKMGDMGLYRYQDLTVLDGSVVRLWDSRWPRNAAAVGGFKW
ncbi:Hypothetical predicted protein [Olea europaea subsp. europaea]|uniref:Uncharacterized protein n=1 Tax=Olea europaea subsp. europaea TaxID=158383 RepID=A0A8S0QCA1_OLEEU|nr:Hypothetical predicted protein [Olea europaea subsp. europaea]